MRILYELVTGFRERFARYVTGRPGRRQIAGNYKPGDLPIAGTGVIPGPRVIGCTCDMDFIPSDSGITFYQQVEGYFFGQIEGFTFSAHRIRDKGIAIYNPPIHCFIFSCKVSEELPVAGYCSGVAVRYGVFVKNASKYRWQSLLTGITGAESCLIF